MDGTKITKCRGKFNRTVKIDPDLGDAWTYFYKLKIPEIMKAVVKELPIPTLIFFVCNMSPLIVRNKSYEIILNVYFLLIKFSYKTVRLCFNWLSAIMGYYLSRAPVLSR